MAENKTTLDNDLDLLGRTALRIKAERDVLLEACKLVVEWYENSGPADPDRESLGSHELWSTCKKAIKQAEGGT